MPKISEFANSVAGQLPSSLRAGLDGLSGRQEIIFRAYKRTVLPADGYVYLLADMSVEPVSVVGSLHYDTRIEMREDEQLGVNRVLLTAEKFVQEFSAKDSSSVIWIGSIDNIRFALSSRGSYYYQADLHHYMGDAIYPAMYDLIIDDPSKFNMSRLIATNSLPIWLSLKTEFDIFPAFLSTSNMMPPYSTVRVVQTSPIQAYPWIDADGSHWQLMADTCRITFYGLGNDESLSFINQAIDFCLDGNVGLMNRPFIFDEARTQKELGAIATKKVAEFQISYYQSHAEKIAKQLILSATTSVTAS